jgi:Fe(3+) dicitrate transport protein
MWKYVLIFGLICKAVSGQSLDTLKRIQLPSIEVVNKLSSEEVKRMPEINGTVIVSGKKNEILMVKNQTSDLSSNNARLIFAKVPGISVWENDASGMQVNVATRGLSPNRSWDFNVRQNGYDISSEVFGYPEAYFQPPAEALDRIEIIRGASSLSYGPQLGGMLNYILKQAPKDKPFEVESYQTKGSFGMFTSYTSVGGSLKRFSYFGYFHYRQGNGWRENNRFNTYTGFLNLKYQIAKNWNLSAEYSRMEYLSQQPGGLSDSAFKADPRASLRSRNWFNVPWNVASLSLKGKIKDTWFIDLKVFGLLAQRNSVGFMKAINIPDTISLLDGQYASRQVDRDYYKNSGAELRVLKVYTLFKAKHSLSTGIRAYAGNIDRNQVGIGTKMTDYDLSISALTKEKEFGRSFELNTQNYAFYVENLFKIGKRFGVTPGLRFEHISSSMSGYNSSFIQSNGVIDEQKIQRNIVLFGVGTQFETSINTNLYANFNQSFRPVTYSELTPSANTDVIDPNLKDGKAYIVDLGFRGKVKDALFFDIGLFYQNYDNRIGSISKDGVVWRTNIGTSVSKGVESFIEIKPIAFFTQSTTFGSLSVFASTAFIDAVYTRWNDPATASDPTKTIANKKVEYAPSFTARYGITYSYRGVSASLQVSNVDQYFTDAANTMEPNTAGTVGLIPAYNLLDLSFKADLSKNFLFKFGINNLTNAIYATRRAGGYPGPGLIPGVGRSFYLTIGIKI